MPTSLPSREIYVIDIPEVKNPQVEFIYNYFVPGEATDEMSGISSRYSDVREDLTNSSDVKRLATRVPRWIQLSFNTVIVNDQVSNTANTTSSTTMKGSTTRVRGGMKKFILDNVSKIMSEEEFASYYYASMDFQDSHVIDKLHTFISGTLLYTSLLQPATEQRAQSTERVSTARGIQLQAMSLMPLSIDSKMLSTALAQNKLGKNFETDVQRNRDRRLLSDITQVTPSAQVNVKFAGSMVERAINDPLCHFDVDLMKTYRVASEIQADAREHLKSSIISTNEFKTKASPVMKFGKTASSTSSRQRVEVIGYMIDKVEVLQDGTILTHDPIIVDNPSVGFVVDFRVKYYSTYTYAVRTIALVTMPAVMEDMNDMVNAQFMISSRPVVTSVNCVENVPPPPVSDLNFVWDYDNENLMLTWSFPPTSQRDVKKFQIYRRSRVEQPFQLLKMYDFDDSSLKASSLEFTDAVLIDTMVGVPKTHYIDKEFNKSSKFIYTLTCVDAHGLSSNYAAQFELSFDRFKNRLVKRLISHAGAPKMYPNLYLESDAFVDTICDGPISKNPSGPHSRLHVYFTPECYNITKNGVKKPVVLTNQDGGKYRLLMINVDNQQQQVVDIRIDNKLGEKT